MSFMSFCPYCGKQLADGVVCNCRNVQTPVAPNVQMPVAPITPVAPVTAASPVTPVTSVLPNEAPETFAGSPFVVPMGNNGFYGGMPAGNGASIGVPAVPVNNDGASDEEYLEATKDCNKLNLLVLIMFLCGVVSILFINEWVAAIIFFIGEFFALVPKMRVQKLCKTKNPTADNRTKRKIEKEVVKKIKAKNKHFIFASIIAYVCLAGLIVSFIVPVPFIKEEKKDSDGMSFVYTPEESTTEVAEPTEAPTTESEVFVPNGPYRPTFDEFLEAYLNGAKECLTLDLSNVYNVVHNGNTVSIGLNAGSIDYMTISCTLVDDRIESIYVNFSTAVFAINSPGSNSDNITMCKMMSLFVPYVAASFQTSNIKMQFDNFWDFVVQVDNMANQNYIYSKSIEMSGCVFSVFATSTFDFFECEVTFPQV